MISQTVLAQPKYRVLNVDNPTPAQKMAWQLGLDPIAGGKVQAEIEQNKTVILSELRIVIRASGRFIRHLSRYLIGVGDDGVLYEFFIDVVNGLRNIVFQLQTKLKTTVIGWLSGGAMSLYEINLYVGG